jgi:hypothetical protein
VYRWVPAGPDTVLAAVDAATGAPRWKVSLGTGASEGNRPAMVGGLVVVTVGVYNPYLRAHRRVRRATLRPRPPCTCTRTTTPPAPPVGPCGASRTTGYSARSPDQATSWPSREITTATTTPLPRSLGRLHQPGHRLHPLANHTARTAVGRSEKHHAHHHRGHRHRPTSRPVSEVDAIVARTPFRHDRPGLRTPAHFTFDFTSAGQSRVRGPDSRVKCFTRRPDFTPGSHPGAPRRAPESGYQKTPSPVSRPALIRPVHGCCPSFVVLISASFLVSMSMREKPRRAGCRAGFGGHVVGGMVILSLPRSRRCARWTRRRWPCWRRTRRAGPGSRGC